MSNAFGFQRRIGILLSPSRRYSIIKNIRGHISVTIMECMTFTQLQRIVFNKSEASPPAPFGSSSRFDYEGIHTFEYRQPEVDFAIER